MSDSVLNDYSQLDRPEILSALFHPRKQSPYLQTPPHCEQVQIEVEKNICIGGRFHMAPNPTAAILFFHGNGEIAADYDELGPIYAQMGINFYVVDYRGYGQSDGTPTVTAMLSDCHLILEYVLKRISHDLPKIPLAVMGRSLGSASVLELVHNRPDAMDALIIESGFAYAGPLLKLLGVFPEHINVTEESGFSNISKISKFAKPTLIIHAEFDHIIPFTDGQKLFDSSPAQEKTLLQIPLANHNDIFVRGFERYMDAVKNLLSQISTTT